MKKLFNGDCCVCGWFKARCAKVHRLDPTRKAVYLEKTDVVCADCRKGMKNRFKLAEEHR